MREDDVEFLDGGADDAVDEELPEPAPPSARRRVALAGGAVAVLLGVLVARVAVGSHSGEPAAAPSPSPSISLAVPQPTGPVTAPPLPIRGVLPVRPSTMSSAYHSRLTLTRRPATHPALVWGGLAVVRVR